MPRPSDLRLRLALVMALFASLACKRDQETDAPDEPEAKAAPTAEEDARGRLEVADTKGACVLSTADGDVVHLRNDAHGYAFTAILPPHVLDCEDPDAISLSTEDGLVTWKVLAVGETEQLDEEAFLRALWAKNESVSNARRLLYGAGFDTTPQGHPVLSHLVTQKLPEASEPASSVMFWTLRQRDDGQAFLMQLIAQVEPKTDPEMLRARMRGPFLPLLDGFKLARRR